MRFYIMTMAMTIAAQCWAAPSIECPVWFGESGVVNDLGLLADAISWDDGYEAINGTCGEYNLLAEANGIYDTRMRVYENTDNTIVINYRPTQMTPAGGDIHVNRVLVPCVFFDGCVGLVHQRFQDAFLDLLGSIPEPFITDNIVVGNRTLRLSGHSLGGSLQLFMALYLWQQHGIVPDVVLGLAGPFIGDEVFTATYQIPFKNLLGDRWWQVESVNRYNTYEFDGTVEGYNVDYEPYISIMYDAVCGLYVDKLPDSYGMHDLRNYRTGMDGVVC